MASKNSEKSMQKSIRKPSKIDAKTDPKQGWHRKSMKNASRHFLRGHLFRHKSIFSRFLGPGRFPKWPPGNARNASNPSSILVAFQKPSRPTAGSLPGGFREVSGNPQGPPGHHFGTIFWRFLKSTLTCKVTMTFYFLHLHFFSDPSLRRVTLIRATEELLIDIDT